MAKKKAITKILSCFLVFVFLTSAIPFSVLASNSSDDVMGEVDTHEDIVVSGVDNATNEAAYDLSDSNITGNASNSLSGVITHDRIVASGSADGVSAKSSTYQTINVLVEYPPDGSTITPDTILILYDNSWNVVKRADTNGYTRYTFTDLDVGTYHVEAYKDNMFIGSAGNIGVGAGEGKFVTIKTFSKRNLDVTVCYKDGSTPIKGVTVKVYSWDGYNEKWDYEYEETTNSQGKVTFSSWPTSCSGEKYKLVVGHNGYTKAKEPVYVDKDSGSSYTITTDEPTEKTFYIRPACQDVNGNHLDGVSYEFVDYPAYKGTCDYNEYVKALGHGSYKVKFTKGDLEATVTLESHLKTFAGTGVTLRKTEKSDIIVIVKDHDDNAVTPDTAILYIPSGDVWKEVKRLNPTSNAYTFTGLDAGTYHTEAYKDNVFIGSAENIEVSVGVCQIAYITTLYKRNLEVKVCYKDGSTPIEGAAVKVYSWDGHNEKWDYEYIGTTNSQGKVTFSSWPTSCSGEKYKLVVEHNGYSKTKKPVYVDKDSGSSYGVITDEMVQSDLSKVSEYHNNATVFYSEYYNKWLNLSFWQEHAYETVSEVIEKHLSPVSAVASAALSVLVAWAAGPLAGAAVTVASAAYSLVDVYIHAQEEVNCVEIYNVLNLIDIDIRSELDSLSKNSEKILTAVEKNQRSQLKEALLERRTLIETLYKKLPDYDNACWEIARKERHFQEREGGNIFVAHHAYKTIWQQIVQIRYFLTADYYVTTQTLSTEFNEEEAKDLSLACPKPMLLHRLDRDMYSTDVCGCIDRTDEGRIIPFKMLEDDVGPNPCIHFILEAIPEDSLSMYLGEGQIPNEQDPNTYVAKGIPKQGRLNLIYRHVKAGEYYLKIVPNGKVGAFELSGSYQKDNIFDWNSFEDMQVEAPKPVIEVFNINEDCIPIDDAVYITVYVSNGGDMSQWQSIEVASPDITKLESYTILGHTLNYVDKYDIGFNAGSNYGTEFKALEYPLVEGAKENWDTDTQEMLKLKIKPEKVGILNIYVKSVAYGNGIWTSDPKIGKTTIKDQQNEYVYVKKVTVTSGGDTTPPETKCTLSPSSPDGEYGWYVTPVTVTLESTDDSSGIEWIKYRIDSGPWQTHPGNKVSFKVSNDGLHYITYYAKDKAGNEEEQKISDLFYIDKTKLSASISINNGAEYTNSGSVTLYLSYSDATSGVRDCGYKNEGDWWGSWESCSSTKSWTLAAGEGTKKVYYRVRDNAGNIKEVYDTIVLKQAQSKLCTSPDPPSHDFGIVSKEKGTSWSFEIRNCGSGTSTWSVSDDKDWITIYPTSGSTTTETDKVTVTIDMECYLGLSPGTYTGHVTISSNGGSKTGTITVIRENQPPTNPTLTPDRSSPQPADTTIKWTASATDPDGDQLYYEFWLKGPATGNDWRIIKSYSTDNTWTWHTTSDDVGESDICVWIRDGHHASKSSKDLEKIVYNYKIIAIKKPDLIVSSINFNPNPAHVGDDVEVSFTVKNQGRGDAGHHYESLECPRVHRAFDCSGLKAGASKTFTNTMHDVDYSDSGSYNVCTDTGEILAYPNQVQESNEDNNCLTAYLDVKEEPTPKKPDLIVSSLTFNPNPANKGSDVTVKVTVKNQGKEDAGPHYEFLGYPDRYTLLKEWYCSGLKAGASRTFTHTLENVQSSDTYEACADWGQVVQESNEDNNCQTAYLEVKKDESHEIKIEGTVIEPDNGYLDSSFDCKVKIDRIITNPSNIDIKEGDEVLVEMFIFCDPSGTIEDWDVKVGDLAEVYGKMSTGHFSRWGHSDSSFLLDLCGSSSYYMTSCYPP